jgi:hypothetical protein
MACPGIRCTFATAHGGSWRWSLLSHLGPLWSGYSHHATPRRYPGESGRRILNLQVVTDVAYVPVLQ